MGKKMKRLIFPFAVVILLAGASYAVIGDLNRDGTVDFDDFFLFADNFGKTGSPEIIDTVRVTINDTLIVVVPDTVKVTITDTLIVEVQEVVYDTLVIDHATVFDTIIFGREEIRFDPPPPSSEIRQSLKIQTNLLNVRIFNYLMGEIRNESSASLGGLEFRLTVRDNNDFVSHTRTYAYGIPDFVISGDTMPFQLSLSDEVDIDFLRGGNYTLDVIWDEEIQKVNNVTVQLDTEKIRYAEPFAISGEIRNTSDLEVKSYEIVFYGRDENGNCIYYQSFSEGSFGIVPNGSSPFSISEVALDYGGPYTQRSDIAQLFYYIKWQWSTSSYSEYEITPQTRLF